MIKLIACDMDGTLLDSQKRLPADFPEVLFHGWVRSSTLHLLKKRLYKQKIPEGSHPPGSFLY